MLGLTLCMSRCTQGSQHDPASTASRQPGCALVSIAGLQMCAQLPVLSAAGAQAWDVASTEEQQGPQAAAQQAAASLAASKAPCKAQLQVLPAAGTLAARAQQQAQGQEQQAGVWEAWAQLWGGVVS